MWKPCLLVLCLALTPFHVMGDDLDSFFKMMHFEPPKNENLLRLDNRLKDNFRFLYAQCPGLKDFLHAYQNNALGGVHIAKGPTSFRASSRPMYPQFVYKFPKENFPFWAWRQGSQFNFPNPYLKFTDKQKMEWYQKYNHWSFEDDFTVEVQSQGPNPGILLFDSVMQKVCGFKVEEKKFETGPLNQGHRIYVRYYRFPFHQESGEIVPNVIFDGEQWTFPHLEFLSK